MSKRRNPRRRRVVTSDDELVEFTPAEEIVFRLDRVVDDLDTIDWLVESGQIPVTDEQRRRMRALFIRLSDDADELFDLATAAAQTDSIGKNQASPPTDCDLPLS